MIMREGEGEREREYNLNGCCGCWLSDHSQIKHRLYLLVESTHDVSQSWDSGDVNHNITSANGDRRATEWRVANVEIEILQWNTGIENCDKAPISDCACCLLFLLG